MYCICFSQTAPPAHLSRTYIIRIYIYIRAQVSKVRVTNLLRRRRNAQVAAGAAPGASVMQYNSQFSTYVSASHRRISLTAV